jgi:adenylate cyclase
MSGGGKRRLAAVLAADVVGYSRLMGADQAGTLGALRQLRSDLFAPSVTQYRGETVKSMGDGWIVAFASVADAVQCAIDIQNGLSAIPSLRLRMGVHIGDIVQEDDDLFGDGVNIAARLQAVAAPGDVLISDVARHSLDGRLGGDFHENPPRKLKNIERTVTTFSWRNARDEANGDDGDEKESAQKRKISLAFEGLVLSGGGEEAELLCAGVNEAIMAAIANQASLSLRTDKENADMMVEGSMQAVGTRYRVAIRLLDRKNHELIKADKFDGVMADLFEAEDDLALRICTSIRFGAFSYEASVMEIPDLPIEEQDSKIIRVHVAGHFGELKHEKWLEARRLLQIVLDRDPEDHSALAMAGTTHIVETCCGWRNPTPEDRVQGLHLLHEAVRVNPRGDFAHAMLSLALLDLDENHAGALFAAEQSLKITPHYAQGQMGLSYAMINAGRVDEGVTLALKAIEPIRSLRLFPWNASYLLLGLLLSRRHDEVLTWGQMADQQVENVPRILLPMISAAVHLQAHDQARDYAARLLEQHKDFNLSEMWVWPLKRAGDWDHLLEGLHAAGLPEG